MTQSSNQQHSPSRMSIYIQGLSLRPSFGTRSPSIILLVLKSKCKLFSELNSHHVSHAHLHQMRVGHTQIRNPPPAILSQEGVEVIND